MSSQSLVPFEFSALSDRPESASGSSCTEPLYRLGHQTWTEQNLCVRSLHEEVAYNTTRWDALCPYIDVNEQMLRSAPRPLLVYALPPESSWGHPIRNAYGMADVRQAGYWSEERRARKFKELFKLHRKFVHHTDVYPGSSLTREDMLAWGGVHFERYGIDIAEVDGFIDYAQNLDVLVLRVETTLGEPVLTDVSLILPERQQVYGSFCQWNPAFRNTSPGLYACLLAAQWTHDQGYEHYNLGPVGDFPYKRLFVNHVEPIYSLALCPESHPLMQDETSPLFTDFERGDWNRLERDIHRKWNADLYL